MNWIVYQERLDCISGNGHKGDFDVWAIGELQPLEQYSQAFWTCTVQFFFFVILSISSWPFFSFTDGTEFRKPVFLEAKELWILSDDQQFLGKPSRNKGLSLAISSSSSRSYPDASVSSRSNNWLSRYSRSALLNCHIIYAIQKKPSQILLKYKPAFIL